MKNEIEQDFCNVNLIYVEKKQKIYILLSQNTYILRFLIEKTKNAKWKINSRLIIFGVSL